MKNGRFSIKFTCKEKSSLFYLLLLLLLLSGFVTWHPERGHERSNKIRFWDINTVKGGQSFDW